MCMSVMVFSYILAATINISEESTKTLKIKLGYPKIKKEIKQSYITNINTILKDHNISRNIDIKRLLPNKSNYEYLTSFTKKVDGTKFHTGITNSSNVNLYSNLQRQQPLGHVEGLTNTRTQFRSFGDTRIKRIKLSEELLYTTEYNNISKVGAYRTIKDITQTHGNRININSVSKLKLSDDYGWSKSLAYQPMSNTIIKNDVKETKTQKHLSYYNIANNTRVLQNTLENPTIVETTSYTTEDRRSISETEKLTTSYLKSRKIKLLKTNPTLTTAYSKTRKRKLLKTYSTTHLTKNSKILRNIGRRQYSGIEHQNRGVQRPYPDALRDIQKDPKIERLLNEYRGLVHKYGPDSQYHQPDYPIPQYPVPQPSNPGSGRSVSGLNGIYRLQNPGRQFLGQGKRWGQSQPRNLRQLGQDGPDDGGGDGGGTTGGDGGSFGPENPQDPNDPMRPTEPGPTTTPDPKKSDAMGQADRFTTRMTTTRRRRRTTPERISLVEDCDYLAYYCLKAYDTGTVCGRTMFFHHYTFENYCMLDYVNCMERYDIWQISHMGDCYNLTLLTEYLHYPYNDDYFLDNYYIVEDM